MKFCLKIVKFGAKIFSKTNNNTNDPEKPNSPDILKRLKVVLNIVENNVDSLRETADTPKVKRQLLLSSYNSRKKSKKTKKRNKTMASTKNKSQTIRYSRYYSPKRSTRVNLFNQRIDPLIKIDTHIPYKPKKVSLFSDLDRVNEESILNKYYPHRFTSPSHSSFSRQPRLSSSTQIDRSYQSSLGKRNRSLSVSHHSKHFKNLRSTSNNTRVVSLSYRTQSPDRPLQRYNKLSVSQID